MDTIEGALIEPLAVGFHAANQAYAQVGQSAVILGAGCIGLVTLMALLTRGVKDVYMVDLIDLRLKKAIDIGAKIVFNAKQVNVVEEIMKISNDKGVDMVFETAGSKIATQQTADLVKRGGKVVIVGMAANPIIEYDFGKLQAKEAMLNTIFRYRNIYPSAIKAVSEKSINVKQIVTDTFGFSEVGKAFNYSIKNKANTVKIIIDMSK